jgi:hypothetical protein
MNAWEAIKERERERVADLVFLRRREDDAIHALQYRFGYPPAHLKRDERNEWQMGDELKRRNVSCSPMNNVEAYDTRGGDVVTQLIDGQQSVDDHVSLRCLRRDTVGGGARKVGVKAKECREYTMKFGNTSPGQSTSVIRSPICIV